MKNFKLILVLIVATFLFKTAAKAQATIINMSSGTETTCFGQFYDSGGQSGNYSSSENITLTIFPQTVGSKLRITFHQFSTTTGDILRIYDGNSVAAQPIVDLQGSTNYGSITSTAADGSLTFNFTSTSSGVSTGWYASVTCVDANNPGAPEDITMIASATYTVCGGKFFDIGGPTANYSDNQATTVTLIPSDPNKKLSVTFNHFLTSAGDYLYVYNGINASATQIARLSGPNYGTITSSAPDGSLTFHFTSTNGSTSDGWEATISTNYIPDDLTMLCDGEYIVSSARFTDNGGPEQNYSDNMDQTLILHPAGFGQKLSVTFHDLSIAFGDQLLVYNGSTPVDLLGTLTGNMIGTITSTASDGSLTFKFISNTGSNASGWHASITTNLDPEDVTMLANNTFHVGCLGRFMDCGGTANNYADNMNVVTTLLPQDALNKVTVTMHAFQTNVGDTLFVFNGSDTTAALLGAYSGVLNQFAVSSTASNGALTFRFVSNAGSNSTGWYGTITCLSNMPAYNMPASGNYTTCNAFFYDSGGPDTAYSNNENSTVTFYPGTSLEKVSIFFTYFQTSNANDFLEIRNGNLPNSPLITTMKYLGGYGTVTSTAPDGSLTLKFISDAGTASIGWAGVISCTPSIQNISLPGTYTVSSGFFTDNGGPEFNYSDNQTSIVTLLPADTSKRVSVNFSDFQTDNVGDYLEVFNGHDIAQPLLTRFKVNSGFGTVTSTAGDGSLTFRFISDANYPATGWKGSISLSAKPTVISQAGTYHVSQGFFYDAGGPQGDYVVSQNYVTTLIPEISGTALSVTFNSFVTDNQNDYLEVYDGNSMSFPLIGKMWKYSGLGTIRSTAPDGSLTFHFVSDANYNGAGWSASISSNASVPEIITPLVSRKDTVCSGYFYDAGYNYAAGVYNNDQNNVVTLVPPAGTGNMQVSFSDFRTDAAQDYMRIYNGGDTNSTVLGTFFGTTNPGTITSSAGDGSLTFQFVSNNVYTASGWSAIFQSTGGCPSAEFLCSEINVGLTEPEPKDLDLRVFPNPFTMDFTINGTQTGGMIHMFDLTGKEVLRKLSEEQTTVLNTSSLMRGFYLLRYNGKKGSKVVKVIKE